MRFKYPRLEAELETAHPILRTQMAFADEWLSDEFGIDLFITSVRRTLQEEKEIYANNPVAMPLDGGPHCCEPPRSADSRIREDQTEMSPIQAQKLADAINKAWSYDYKRPKMVCALVHDAGSGITHLHVQCHPNTKMRK